jgi:hypothetical protein
MTDAKALRIGRARREMWANRQRGLQVTDEETCRTEGLSLQEFWDFLLKDEMKASDFKRLLYEGFLSPRGWDRPLLFDTLVSKLLRKALEVGKTFVGQPPQGKGGEHGELIVQRPRETIEWILERRKDLIPSNLQAYVKGIVEAEQGPTPQKQPNVSEAKLVKYLNDISDGEKKDAELIALAVQRFPGQSIPDDMLQKVLPTLRKKRRRGETDRTLNKRKRDNPAA